MNDMPSVRGLECFSRLESQRYGRIDRQATGCFRQHRGQITPVEQFHDYKQVTIVGADVMHDGNPRMLQPGRDSSLVPEPFS